MRRLLQVGILTMFVGAALFVAWGVYVSSQQAALSDTLRQQGVQSTGRVVDKSKSSSESGSSSTSYVVEVTYAVDGRVHTRPFSVNATRYAELTVDSTIEVVALPEDLDAAQLAEALDGSMGGQGFIVR